ncbi:hypothetical protein SLEP1_g59209 [Rubroshorea leprosula]|uniref:Uncharacterized protein n=1 Tax=Rubroshorea leprosula TaxID=152421 RepID=A0AAV5MV85_9ROSI|nr:hypothetical protein SLEP1_g59209 [Rubroshorea leprosula]
MLNPPGPLAHPVSLVESLARRRDSPRESLSQMQMLESKTWLDSALTSLAQFERNPC